MNKKVVITILVILALCCCVLVVGIGGYLVYQGSSTTTRSPRSTSTPVDIAASPIVTSTAVVIPSPEASSTPKSSMKQVSTLFDAFDNNNNGWAVGSREGDNAITTESISNGKMKFAVKAKKSVVASDTLWSQAIYNFDLSADGYKIDGAADSDYALIFRRLNSDNYYVFGISPDYQEYIVAVKKNGEWTDLIKWKKSMYINTKSVNNMRVIANGSKFTFMINDTKVDEITDTSINEGGELGIAAELYQADDTVNFEYDNFQVIVKD